MNTTHITVTCESLMVGDRVLDCRHGVLVGGTVTRVNEDMKDIYAVHVIGGNNINAGGKSKALIKCTNVFVVERAL